MAVRGGASYKKHYNADWEKESEFKVWLTRTEEKLVMKGHGEAFCKLCSTSIRAHRTDLLWHRKTAKHVQKESAVVDRRGRLQPTIVQVVGNQYHSDSVFHNVDAAAAGKTKLKENDLKLACYIACHSSIKSIDHLGELLRETGEGSKLADLRLHRTKCSKLILKILGPSMQQERLDDLGQGYYSVIVDESTDVSVKNYMAVIIRYYSFNKKEMVIDFVGLIQLNRATAEALYEAFTNFMKSRGFDLRRCIGLGTDGAPALCGCNHSMYTLLKQNECPNTSLVRCICHSLDKCTPYATPKAPPMLVKLAATRWLSWGNAVARVLQQFEVLRELFKAEAPSCHSAQIITQLYHPTHQLYLTFLKPVLLDINSHN
ncbi:Zinc finger protein 862 [Frankliniella fusca]|uniref:Zinc finger protein 862 n=1 Tax=Frankliniella fusca TaxID=407009 RepID=A0AAE1LJ60_9NEOP|nr:Zinc finger protein 862 [Frankliniella fusca]